MDEPYGKCQTCGVEYDHEPALDVACPTCGAEPGAPCFHLSPSGHRKSLAFHHVAGCGPWGHRERDLTAVIEGAYKCEHGLTPEAARKLLAAKQARRKRIAAGEPHPYTAPAQTALAL